MGGSSRSRPYGYLWLTIWSLVAMLAAMISISVAAQPARAPVIGLDIQGAIGPATTEYVRQGLATARTRGSPLVVLRLDTPGGLDSATREIISDILASPTPVVTYVSPAGARAASAGTYILYASHLAAMTPGTYLGAATPVSLGGGPSPLPGGGTSPDEKPPAGGQLPDAMSAKVVNDAAAYIASLAALQGRNAAWAERAVREAATLTSEQAQLQSVIELRPASLQDLLAQADGRIVQLAGRPHVLNLAGSGFEELRPSWRIQALAAITNPNIAFFLLLVGVYGLLFEFLSPGAIGPGVVGAVALVVALFALNLLPVNYAGLALLLLGIGLMAVEAFTPSFGVLGLGGAVAFAIGSLMLFKGPVPELRLAPAVVVTAAALSLAYFILALGAAARTRHAALAIGPTTLLGAGGHVVNWSGDRGLVEVQGEHWQARASAPLAAGWRVRVASRDGLLLTVELEHDASQAAADGRPDSA